MGKSKEEKAAEKAAKKAEKEERKKAKKEGKKRGKLGKSSSKKDIKDGEVSPSPSAEKNEPVVTTPTSEQVPSQQGEDKKDETGKPAASVPAPVAAARERQVLFGAQRSETGANGSAAADASKISAWKAAPAPAGSRRSFREDDSQTNQSNILATQAAIVAADAAANVDDDDEEDEEDDCYDESEDSDEEPKKEKTAPLPVATTAPEEKELSPSQKEETPATTAGDGSSSTAEEATSNPSVVDSKAPGSNPGDETADTSSTESEEEDEEEVMCLEKDNYHSTKDIATKPDGPPPVATRKPSLAPAHVEDGDYEGEADEGCDEGEDEGYYEGEEDGEYYEGEEDGEYYEGEEDGEYYEGEDEGSYYEGEDEGGYYEGEGEENAVPAAVVPTAGVGRGGPPPPVAARQPAALPPHLMPRRLQSVPVVSRNRPVPPRGGSQPLFRVPTLDRSNMGLETIPEEIFDRDYLTKLVVKRNKLKEFPPLIHKLTNLLVLDISYNYFEQLPKGVTELTQLAHLLVDGNRLCKEDSLPSVEEFAKFKDLVHLGLDANRLKEFPPQLKVCNELERLSMNRNLFTSVPPLLAACKKLTYLDLSSNQIQSLPSEICELEALEELYLEKNNLQSLPESLVALACLRKIDLSYNQLKILPLMPSSILSIKAGRNRITKLPDNLGDLDQLVTLDLLDNCVTELPETFYTRLALQEVNLSLNQISNVSSAIGNLENLITFRIANNKLSVLPDEIGKLVSLNELNVSFNQLLAIPDIGDLEELRFLYIGYNKLSSLPSFEGLRVGEVMISGNPELQGVVPDSLWKCEFIRVLYACNIGLASISSDVGTLENLERIDLCFNQIKTIPDEIAIPGLQRLAISHNQLDCEIPEDFDELMELLELDLAYNQFHALPAELDRPKDRGCDIILDGLPSDCNTAEFMDREVYQLSPAFRMGYAEVIGKRPTMEDAFSIEGKFGTGAEFWGLYDGHAGRNAATFSAKEHPPLLRTLLATLGQGENNLSSLADASILEAMDKSYFQVNDAFRKDLKDRGGNKHAGTTAVALLRVGTTLYVSNVGDSRAVLCRGGKALRISFDHKPTDIEEEDRIRSQGGYVMVNGRGGSGRVNGGLAVSRSIGDFYMHPYVTEKPYLNQVELTEEDTFLVLACDGLFDELEDQTVVDTVAPYVDDPALAAARARDLAYVCGSDDNISVIVIDLTRTPEGSPVDLSQLKEIAKAAEPFPVPAEASAEKGEDGADGDGNQKEEEDIPAAAAAPVVVAKDNVGEGKDQDEASQEEEEKEKVQEVEKKDVSDETASPQENEIPKEEEEKDE